MATKNKRYYWLKLPTDFFQTDAMAWLEEQENGVYYTNFYLKLCLASINNNGILIRQVGSMFIPYDIKGLSKMTGIGTDTVIVAIELLKKAGLLEIMDNGAFYLTQVEGMVGSETDSAKRMRKSREKAKDKELGNRKLNRHFVTHVTQKTSHSDKTLSHSDKTLSHSDESSHSDKNVTIERRERDKSIEIDKKEEEDKEEKKAATTSSQEEIYKLYAGEISRNGLYCSPLEMQNLNKLLNEYGADKLRDAITIAVMRNKRSLGYIIGVLKAEQRNKIPAQELGDEYNIDF